MVMVLVLIVTVVLYFALTKKDERWYVVCSLLNHAGIGLASLILLDVLGLEIRLLQLAMSGLPAAAFGALDYLLHIPVSRMSRENSFYREVVRYIRNNRPEIVLNPYLSRRERRNLWLLSFAPRTLRALHRRIKRL